MCRGGGGIFFDGAHAAAVLHGWRQWISDHTENTSSSVALLRLPDDPRLPDPIRGRFVANVRMAHVGDSREGAQLAQHIRAVAPMLLDTLGDLPPTSLDLVHMDPPPYLLFALAPDVPALAQATPEAVDSLFDAVAPWRSAARLPNFLGRIDDPADVAAAWPSRDRARLIEIKQTWDPANLFRLGHPLVGAGRRAKP